MIGLGWISILLIAVVAEGFAPATGSVIVYVFLVKEELALAAILVTTSISKALVIAVEVIEVGLLLLVVCVVVVQAHWVEREARVEVLTIVLKYIIIYDVAAILRDHTAIVLLLLIRWHRTLVTEAVWHQLEGRCGLGLVKCLLW